MQLTSIKCAIKTECNTLYKTTDQKKKIAIEQVKYLSYNFADRIWLMSHSSELSEVTISFC